MKKVEKGNPGYLDYQKKVEIIRTIIYFALVAAILLLGYSQTHTKKNLLTVVGIVGCLPSSKALVGVITRLPYRSVKEEIAREVSAKTTHLTTAFDMVVTSREKIMPIECVVVSGDKVFGYVSNPKVNLNETASYLKSMIHENQLGPVSVKLFDQYSAFLARVEGLNNIAEVEKADTKEQEMKIRKLILNLSL